MAKVLLAIWTFILQAGFSKTTHIKMNDQIINLIDFSRKNLTTMPDVLHNSTTDLYLGGNYLHVVPAWSFRKSRILKNIDLSDNRIRFIEQGAFDGLVELSILNLRSNLLTSNSLYKNIFQGLISLQDLVIHDNYFIDNNTFFQTVISRVKSLVKLHIDLSRPHQIYKCLCNLSKLQDIEIFELHGLTYSDKLFQNLKCLKIETLWIDSVLSLAPNTFMSFPNLKTLGIAIHTARATYDVISNIFHSLKIFKGRNMTQISITGNPHRNGFVLGHSHFAVLEKICLQKLKLVGDSILGVKFNPFLRYGRKENCLEELNLSDNLLFDSKDSYVFAFCAFKHLKIIRIPHMVVKDNRVKRSTKNDVSFSFCLPKTLEQYDLHCHVKSYNRRRISNITIINGSNLKVLNMANVTFRDCNGTVKGATNLEYFDMSGFNCNVLGVNLLSHFPKLITLIAQDANLGIGLNALQNASEFLKMNLDLQHIDLMNNNLKTLPDGLFCHPFRHKLSIILDRNNLQSLPNFPSKQNKIKLISLKYNRFSCLSEDDMAKLNIIKPSSIFLRGNPIECSCNTLHFLKWVHQSGLISDVDEIECVLQTGTLSILSQFLRNLKKFEISCQTKLWVTLASCITSVTILALIFGIIYYRYRFAFEYFFLRIKMKLRHYQPLLEDFNHDAFISYSHKDISWIKTLYDNLQSKGFSLCLYHKDFKGGMPIAECIVEAINSSRKVVFVITEDFLESSWGTYEIEMTRMHAFREGRESMIIVILKDDIKKDKLPKALKEIWYKVVCIVWPSDPEAPYNSEEIFYKKLCTALSDGRMRINDDNTSM
ncbi:toll-like receptor 4 [Mytilus californianus]|uniref:toll-like receptor 4 n=1 Tax=Mytilus californianus TaxID=6549 RepID=UPI00224573E1|nr:toll-like receptor 4 [Mytilus californianus]